MKKKGLFVLVIAAMTTMLAGCNKNTDIDKYEGTVMGNKQAVDEVDEEFTGEAVEATFDESVD